MVAEDQPSSPAVEQAAALPKPAAPAATQAVLKAATRVAPSPAKAGLGGLGGGNKCAVCAKAVYAADPQFAADGKLFHKNCFKCLVCKSQLGLSSLAQIEGFCLCKPCYKTEFKMRGKVSNFVTQTVRRPGQWIHPLPPPPPPQYDDVIKTLQDLALAAGHAYYVPKAETEKSVPVTAAETAAPAAPPPAPKPVASEAPASVPEPVAVAEVVEASTPEESATASSE